MIEPQLETPAVVTPDPNAAIQEQIKALQNELKETKEEASYWRQHQAAADRTPEPEEEETELTISEDLADAVGSNDAKRVMGAIKQMGFASTKDVESMIQTATQRVATEGQVFTEYPDLKDPKSEMFKRTASEYKELTHGLSKDAIKKNASVFIAKAAKLAAIDLDVEPVTAKPRKKAADDGDFEQEQERQTRVRSQQPTRSNRERTDDGSSDELSPQQARLVAALQRSGAPINEESYRASAKRGVSVGGHHQQGRRA